MVAVVMVVVVAATLFVPTIQSDVSRKACGSDEVRCREGSCVSLAKRCNFVADCPGLDATDEEGCVPAVCTFEDGTCGWVVDAPDPFLLTHNLHHTEDTIQEDTKAFMWVLSQGQQTVDPPLQQYKPGSDVTTKKPSGYYMYAMSAGEMTDASTTFTTNLTLGALGRECRLTFWYWWYGPDAGSLHVVVRDPDGQSREAWMTDGDHGDEWQLGTMRLGGLKGGKLVLEARRGAVYEGGSALDDLTFEECQPPSPPPDGKTCADFDMFQCGDGACCRKEMVCDFSNDCFDKSDEVTQMCQAYKFRCSFEDGFTKDWHQDEDDDTQWVFMQGFGGEGIATLPQDDHTTGEGRGHYIKMKIEEVTEPEIVARLKSPVIYGSTKMCHLRLWYMFTGTNPGLLKVYRRTSHTADGLTLVITLTNRESNLWLDAIILLDTEDTAGKDFEAVIEGVSPADRDGYILLDDLSMTPSCDPSSNQNLPGDNTTTIPPPFCFPGQLLCDNDRCYNPIEACNFMDDCGDNTDEEDCSEDCTFDDEEDLCGWFQEEASSAPWVNTGFPIQPPGPQTDHFNMNNTRIMASAVKDSRGKVSILKSLSFTTMHEKCSLEFWYYMAGTGAHNASLSLYRKAEQDVAAGYGAQALWQQTVYASQWNKQEVQIGDARNFVLYFEGVHGDAESFMALDDFTFHSCVSNGECHSTLDFTCADGSCVPYQRRCDANYDCADKSDEYRCKKLQGDCSFEGSDWQAECGWVQSQDDDKDWAAATGSPTPGLGPAHHHALTAWGQYLYMANQEEEPGQTAAISISKELYPPSEGICYLRYWYFLHNDNDTVDTGTLRLIKEGSDGRRYPLVIHSGNYMDKWLQEVVLVSSSSPFRLLFEGETGDPYQTYMAIDDVSVTPSCVSGVLPPSNTTCQAGERACASGECVAEDFFCDCWVDCADGSDEKQCGSVTCKTTAIRPTTTTTTPIPSPCTEKQFYCNDKNSTCLPGLLVCDGVPDCANAADEDSCPAEACEPGFVYCGDKYLQDSPCMSLDNLCNSYIFCHTYDADESLCGVCPPNYCLNGGQCTPATTHLPNCSCSGQHEGFRCRRNTGSSSHPLNGGQIAGIVIGSLAAVGLAASLGFVLYRRHQRKDGS